jgi:hypothetical protein
MDDAVSRGKASLAPDVAVAFALRATPGGYAVLLGSGVSRAAGVPTGYEVLVDLCRRVAAAFSAAEAASGDPAGWFRQHTGAVATYDTVLASVAGTPEERIGLLRGYFEPNDDERDQGLKVPTAGHRALAQLVEAGLVRIVLTTNFDRLVEHALDERGIPYVVTATPSAIKGALPLHLQRCQVVKLHGDYLDPGLLNTPEELATYPAEVNDVLDRVLDEYGLIVVGWSAIYDPALRSALERSTSRRFSSWWVSPGSLSDHAQRLIALRDIAFVPGTADAFLGSVADVTATLGDLDRSAPQTVTLAAANAKRAFSPSGNRIRLHDRLKEELSRVTSSPQVTRVRFDGTNPQDYGLEAQRLEAEAEVLLALVAVSAYWGDDQTDRWWLPAISMFADRFGQTPASGDTPLINLTRYPGLLLFQTGVVAAAAAPRWNLFARLNALQLENVYTDHRQPAAVSLDPRCVLGGWSTNRGRTTGVPVNDRPSEHVRGLLQDLFTTHVLLTPSDYALAADAAEYLLCVSSLDEKMQLVATPRPGTAPAFAPTRSIPDCGAWREVRIRMSTLVQGPDGPLAMGMFGGEMQRFLAAAGEFEEELQRIG